MIDILAIGAHPDDCEISMGGSLFIFKKLGYSIAVCDLTRGELGTYGDSQTRQAESQKSSELLALDARFSLDIPDGNIENTQANREKLIQIFRTCRPKWVFGFDTQNRSRHPDHRNAGWLVAESLFYSGLVKVLPDLSPHRPQALITFPEIFFHQKPDFIVDISDVWELKIKAIQAYSSQVSTGSHSTESAKTFLHSNHFWEVLESRGRYLGAMIGAQYGEPFFTNQPLALKDPFSALPRRFL